MTTSAPVPLKFRIESIDILRGIIMLIMAIDHCRDYFQFGQPDATDLHTTTPILFFTRFITHFCAPTFVFLSGISAYLAGTRRTKSQLSAFLIKRGLWLLVVEFVIICFAMTSDPGYHVFIFQVIWAIGGSMILLGLLIWAPLSVIAAVGVIIFFAHNIFDYIGVGPLGETLIWKLLIAANGFGNVYPIGNGRILLLAYALLPWTGVMLLGYVFGAFYKKTEDAARRRKILLFTGLSLLSLFIILRTFNIYGDPAPWSVQKTGWLSVISFLNVTKYPCSLLYLCVTLGVSLVVLSLVENVSNKITAILIVYGNVPLFYYICHWYLIKLIYTIMFLIDGYTLKDTTSFNPPPKFGYSLGTVYLIWLFVIAFLYLPCKWYSGYKKSHKQWWLSYL